jgi:hypothetical protein
MRSSAALRNVLMLLLAGGMVLFAGGAARAVLLPTPTPCVIDNFNNDGSFYDTAGQADAGWWVSNSQTYTLQMAGGVGGDYTDCLKVTFNKPAGEEWAFIAAGSLDQPGNQTDFSATNTLSLHLYGATSLLIKFRDQNGNESADSGILPAGNANAWSTVTWDYTNVSWRQCDRGHIKDIIIFIQPGQIASGVCYLDDLTLGDAGAPPQNDANLLIDNFDNDNAAWMTANQRNAQWEPVDSAAYQFSMVNNPGILGDSTPYLTVHYTKPAGKEWAYFEATNLLNPGNRCDFSQEHLLSMHVYGLDGDVKLLMKFRDRYGNESADSGVIAVACHNQWQKLTWDYSAINWNQCDRHQIASVILFAKPGETGEGTFCLDNVTLGAGTEPPLPMTATITATATMTPTPGPSGTDTPVATYTPGGPYLMIDDFADGNAQDGPGRDAYWYFNGMGSSTGQMDFTQAGQGVPSLKVVYNKPHGEEWTSFTAAWLDRNNNLTDFTVEHRLTICVYGQIDLKFAFRQNNHDTAMSPTFSATNPNGWTVLTWDYSGLAWGDCDPHHVTDLVIFPEPGLIASGTFYIRYVMLGNYIQPDPPTPTPTITPTITITPTAINSMTSTMTTTSTSTPTQSMTITLSPTVTYTPASVPDDLIDNFDNDASFASQPGARDGEWFADPNRPLTIVGSIGGARLRLYCPGIGTHCVGVRGLDAPGKKTDFSQAHYLTFYCANGSCSDVYTSFQLVDSQGNTANSEGFVLRGTQNYRVMIGKWGNCDPHHICEIRMTLDQYDVDLTLDNFMTDSSPVLTPTPGPWDESLIDNFDNDADLASVPGQRDGSWTSTNGTPLDVIGYYGNANMVASGASAGFAVSGLDAPGKKSDFSRATGIRFHMGVSVNQYAEYTQPITYSTSVYATVMDRNGVTCNNQFYISYSGIGATVSWSGNVIIPLDWGACDRQHIQRIYFSAYTSSTMVSYGFDDFRADEILDSNTVIDNFDNDASPAAASGQRDANWSSSNPQVYSLAAVTDADQNSTPCLRVVYNKPAGEEWSFIQAGGLDTAGKFGDFSQAGSVSLDVYGTVSLMVKFVDVNQHESAMSSALTTSNPAGWTTLGYNLLNMNWGQCDRSHIQRILIFVMPGQTGSGTFWLDNLMAYTVNGGVSAASVQHPAHWCWTKTTTPTPTATASSTPAGAASTMTATPTATCTMTSTRDIGATGVTAYPNPARNQVQFAWQGGPADRARIEIFNSTGERITRIVESHTATATWLASQVPAGIYYYQVYLTRDGVERAQGVHKIAIVK